MTSDPRPAVAALACALLCCTVSPAAAQDARLTLHDAVRRSLEHHPRLAAAEAGQAEAAAALREAGARRWPDASAQATMTRFQEPMIVAPLHELDLGTPPVFDRTLVQGRLSLGYVLFDGGRRGAGIGRARALDEAAAAGVAAARMQVMEDATSSYLGVLTSAGVAEAHRRRISALEAERQRVAQLLAEGRAARVELLRVEAALASARADLVAAEAAVDVAAGSLARVSGIDRRSITPSRLVDVTAAPAVEPDVEPADALEANPRVQQARRRAAALRQAERGARAAWFPTVNLTGGLLTFSGIEGHLSAEWQAGVAVSYPLFTGGGRGGAIDRAAAAASQGDEELRLVELQVQDEVERALASYRENRAQVAALSTAVEHLVEVARIEQLALSAGAGVQTDYLAAEADLARARAGLARARHMEILARVQLARTRGELTEAWLAAYLENES
jgi:outer membrane protein